MDKLFGDLKGFFATKKCTIDSFVFRLHYRFTLVVLIAFSITVTGRQYLGDPIDCISKDDIPHELLDTYCWITTTFSIVGAWHKKVGDEVPYPGVDKHTPGEKRVYHAYYQWVCFVLFLQALLFYVPRYFWKNMEGHRCQNLLSEANSLILIKDDKDKEKILKEVNENKGNLQMIINDSNKKRVRLLIEYLVDNRKNHRVYGISYVIAEVMNFVNVVGQICLIDTFLGGEFSRYGINVASFTEWDWTVRYDPMIQVFPRMTKCTFHRYGSSGDVQKHDAMCLLPINIMNEKIYIFLWFWFVILAVITGLELFYRLLICLSTPFRRLILHSKCPGADKSDVRTVVEDCDRCDWLLLSLLCKNMYEHNFKEVIHKFAKEINVINGKHIKNK